MTRPANPRIPVLEGIPLPALGRALLGGWRWLLGATLTAMLLAALVSLFLEPRYLVSVVIKPGLFIEDDQRYGFDDAEALVERLRLGVYDDRLIRAAGLDEDEELVWRITKGRGISQIMLSLTWPDPPQGQELVRVLLNLIAEDLNFAVEPYRVSLSMSLREYDERLASSTRQRADVQDRLDRLEEEIRSRQARLARLQEGMAQAAAGRDNEGNLYSALMWQSLQGQLQGLEVDRTRLLEFLQGLEAAMADLSSKRAIVADRLERVRAIELLTPIEASLRPVAPRRGMIVASAGLLALVAAALAIVVLAWLRLQGGGVPQGAPED